MNGSKPAWVGIAPTPKVFGQLDQEETTVLAFLAWAATTNRPVTSLDVAALPDRDGSPLGIEEARHITETLADLKIASVLGMRNDKPLSIFLGGFQPRGGPRAPFRDARSPHPPQARHPYDPGRPGQVPAREARPAAPPRPAPTSQPFVSPRAPRPAPAAFRPSRSGPAAPKPKFPKYLTEHGEVIENKTKVLPRLRATHSTPDFVMREAQRLRNAQIEVEKGKYGDDLVGAAEERLRILKARIDLYQRWLKVEPGHSVLAAFLEQKRKAVPDLEFQLERVRMPGGSHRHQKRKAEEAEGAQDD